MNTTPIIRFVAIISLQCAYIGLYLTAGCKLGQVDSQVADSSIYKDSRAISANIAEADPLRLRIALEFDQQRSEVDFWHGGDFSGLLAAYPGNEVPTRFQVAYPSSSSSESVVLINDSHQSRVLIVAPPSTSLDRKSLIVIPLDPVVSPFNGTGDFLLNPYYSFVDRVEVFDVLGTNRILLQARICTIGLMNDLSDAMTFMARNGISNVESVLTQQSQFETGTIVVDVIPWKATVSYGLITSSTFILDKWFGQVENAGRVVGPRRWSQLTVPSASDPKRNEIPCFFDFVTRVGFDKVRHWGGESEVGER